jgi:hypothetical protein
MRAQAAFEALGLLSPALVLEAAPEYIPVMMKRRIAMKKKLCLILAAALLVAALTAIVIGTGASASPRDGRPISDAPVYIPMDTYTDIVERMLVNIGREDLFVVDERGHFDGSYMYKEYRRLDRSGEEAGDLFFILRFNAFYAEPLRLDKEKYAEQIAELEKLHPIWAVTEDICPLDISVTPKEEEFIIYCLMAYAGFTQQELVELYTELHAMVEASGVENKEEILATLPPIPEAYENVEEPDAPEIPPLAQDAFGE